MYKTEIARQIIVEMIEITERIEATRKQLMPSHVVKMYEEFLKHKKQELLSVSS
jgi:hypothetical protein